MKTFKQYLDEATFGGSNDFNYSGHNVGDEVKINEPGHENHGKTGIIRRQMGMSLGVSPKVSDLGGSAGTSGKMSWHNAANLKKAN